ncbi:MAG TPA: hypothetical protein VGR62_20250 [Candidatus Binatia bacterium]|nr:hypothetical protein [Candidatus Binatia bacterium]
MLPPACPGVRFLVEAPLVPGVALPFDAIAIDDAGQVSIDSGCAAVAPRTSRRGTVRTIRARWTACGSLRSVRLTVKVDEAGCDRITGTFSGRGIRRVQIAAPASACGDGTVDPAAGEACERDPDCAGGEACTVCQCGAPPVSTTTTSTTSSTSTSRPPTTVTTTTRPTTTSTSTSSTTSSRPPTTVVTTTLPTTTTTTSSSSSSSTSTSTSSTTTSTSGATTSTTIGSRLFEAANPWNTDVSALTKSATSDGTIQALNAAGGWGAGALRIDFSIEVLEADGTTPFRTFTPTDDFYSPDCDHVPFPVPPGGALEGETGYQCASDGDCHLIVVHRPTKKLYEMWRANIAGSSFQGGCAAVWDLTRAYPATLRGDQCSSADAGGFPIAAMLFSADEVARGSIDHAIRFILPNSRMRSGVYVRPASHAGGPSGGGNLPPYGVRFRLRADYPIASLPTEGARVVARAMQTYGMILSDGGNIALTAQSDRFTTHKWDEVGVDSRSLQAIRVTDMEVVGMGATIPLTYDCVRN